MSELLLCTFRVSGLAVMLLLAGVFIDGNKIFAQEGRCFDLRGKLAPEAVTEGCTSVIGVCATGAFTGLLTRLNFVGTAITQTDLSEETGIVVLTGESVTDIRNFRGEPGTILHRDTIALNTGGNFEFTETDVIVGGTGPFEGATGSLQIIGTFPPTGVGDADYQAHICLPE